MKKATIIFLIFVLMVLSKTCNTKDVVTENIMFIEKNGKNYLYYQSLRSTWENYTIYYKNRGEKDPEEHLKDYFFLYPKEYEWSKGKKKTHDQLKFPEGSYSILYRGNMGTYLNIDKDGVYTYKNWDGKIKEENGHYGIWSIPGNFRNFVYVWVFPEEFTIIDHKCNQKGEWEKRHNTISFYAKDVNDLVFTIKYKKKNEIVSKPDVLRKSDYVFGDSDLFANTEVKITDSGKNNINKIISALKEKIKLKIGIIGYINEESGSNQWKLKSEKNLCILNYLMKHGVTEDRIKISVMKKNKSDFEIRLYETE